jgi:hypothetical protein
MTAAVREATMTLVTRLGGLLAVLAIVVSATGSAAAAKTSTAIDATPAGKWQAAQTHLAFPLYRPTKTLGLGLNQFKRECANKRVWATYGTYHGLQAKGHGFLVIEAWPSLCSNPNYSRPLGRYRVDGRRGTLGVYCVLGHTCTAADGQRNGFTFFVTLRSMSGRRTAVFLDSAGLTKRQFLSIVQGLRALGHR